MPAAWKNKLFFGDSLGVLREAIADESVDLVYDRETRRRRPVAARSGGMEPCGRIEVELAVRRAS